MSSINYKNKYKIEHINCQMNKSVQRTHALGQGKYNTDTCYY
jgi:hypothetical protein